VSPLSILKNAEKERLLIADEEAEKGITMIDDILCPLRDELEEKSPEVFGS